MSRLVVGMAMASTALATMVAADEREAEDEFKPESAIGPQREDYPSRQVWRAACRNEWKPRP